MTEYTLEASVKLGMIEYALVASVDPYGSLLAEGIAECHYTGPQPVTCSACLIRPFRGRIGKLDSPSARPTQGG
jgi:hypothetical protein